MTVTLCLIDSLLSSDLLGSLPAVVIILTSTSIGNNAAKAPCAVRSFAGSAIDRPGDGAVPEPLPDTCPPIELETHPSVELLPTLVTGVWPHQHRCGRSA